MVKWLSRARDRRNKRRAERRANHGERAERRNAAKALRQRHERFDEQRRSGGRRSDGRRSLTVPHRLSAASHAGTGDGLEQVLARHSTKRRVGVGR